MDDIKLKRFELLCNYDRHDSYFQDIETYDFNNQEKEWNSNSIVNEYKLLYFLSPQKHKNLLNIGGNWKEFKIYESLGFDCTHINISDHVVSEIIKDGGKAISGDACSLPFDNKSFDAVTSIQTLEHIFYPWKVLFEIYRVLDDGGRGMINMPVWYKDQEDVDLPQHDLVNLQHVSVLQPYQLKFMVRNAGFKVLKHIVYFNQQIIYFDKLSVSEIKQWPHEDKFSIYYNDKLAQLLTEYTEMDKEK